LSLGQDRLFDSGLPDDLERGRVPVVVGPSGCALTALLVRVFGGSESTPAEWRAATRNSGRKHAFAQRMITRFLLK
jgi:hypothetical protein